MSLPSLRLVRACIWIALSICVIIDGGLADYAISPGGCLVYFDKNGNFIIPRPSPDAWIWVAGFVLIQSALIFALIRLRRHKQASTPIWGQPSS
jgi:hypothetical protein